MLPAAPQPVPISSLPHGSPRAAATLVVVRDAAVGIEVLLLRRAERGDHNSGAWVFPGGMVEPGDRLCHPRCAGLDDAAASARLGLPRGGLDYYVAAVRECFEEAGLLLALDAHGALLDLRGRSVGRRGVRGVARPAAPRRTQRSPSSAHGTA